MPPALPTPQSLWTHEHNWHGLMDITWAWTRGQYWHGLMDITGMDSWAVLASTHGHNWHGLVGGTGMDSWT